VTFRKEVAENVGVGFEIPTQAALVAPNAPNVTRELVKESAA
jgi:hypothetical protein